MSTAPGLGEESVPRGEEKDNAAIAAGSVGMLNTAERPVRRGEHPKSHGVVRGSFTVPDGLPESLRHGVFREPGTYPCWVRFSSSAQEDDAKGDGHGMAIKLMEVEGRKILEWQEDERTQDFIVVDSPVMFMRNAKSGRAFVETMALARRPSLLKSLLFWQTEGQKRLTYIILRYVVLGLRFHELGCLLRASSRKPASPLLTPYWSTTPYRLGPEEKPVAVKYGVRPRPASVPAPTDFHSEHRLRAAMVEHLNRADAHFDFLVQVQADPVSMPVEDATIEWDESVSPFQRVATITIPRQVFDTPELTEFGENLSYTPWHSLPEHRPLGGLNRARKVTYEADSRRRHELNEAPRREPAANDGPFPAEPEGPPVLEAPRSVAFHHVLADEIERIQLRRKVLAEQEETGRLPGPETTPPPLHEAAGRLERAVADVQLGGIQKLAARSTNGDGQLAAAHHDFNRRCLGEAGGLSDDDMLDAARRQALDLHLAGLAFSGGGIRAGTFAVGIAQGLATLGLLRRFDYLSTVSGGGYAGGWLAAWMKREGDPRNVEDQLNVSRVGQARAVRDGLEPGDVVEEEPEPVRHLRAYSSYMNPRPGMFTSDTWSLLAIYFRNVLVNFLMLVPATLALVFLFRLAVWLSGFLLGARGAAQGVVASSFLPELPAGVPAPDIGTLVAAVLAPFCFAAGLYWFARAFRINGRALPRLRNASAKGHGVDGPAVTRCVTFLLTAAVLVTVSAPALLALLRATLDVVLRGTVGDGVGSASAAGIAEFPFLSAWNVAFHMVLFGGLMWLIARRTSHLYMSRPEDQPRFHRAAFSAGAVGGLLLAFAEAVLQPLFDSPPWFLTLAPPLALAVMITSMSVVMGMLGRTATPSEREWWSRLSGLLGLWGLAWAAALGSIVLLPAVLLGSGAWVRGALASGFLTTTVVGVLTGFSARTKGDGGDKSRGTGSRGLALIATLVPPLFLAGLLGGTALLASFLVGDPWVGSDPDTLPTFGSTADVYFRGFNPLASHAQGGAPVPFLTLLVGFCGTAGAAWFFSRYVDVNLFSLQEMYASRLTRCFLGASRPRTEWVKRWSTSADRGGPVVMGGAPTHAFPPPRDPNPITGFDPIDDLKLNELAIGATSPPPGSDVHPTTYWGPHLILNTSLNLIAGSDLAWRDRKGESFSITPLYCGSKSTGYAPMSAEAGEVLTLGRSVAISGAAVDPNMGVYHTAPMTALLTLFNARLGSWLENPTPPARDLAAGPLSALIGKPGAPPKPAAPEPWRAESPHAAGLLFDELMGRTSGDKKFVHVSDGGHFENLGVYELVRRRCRYIVSVDSAEDSNASGENLGNLVRLCRVDFGVRVQLDTTPLVVFGPGSLCKGHVVIGKIRYDDVDQGESPGILVYIKISMTGDEPPDVQQYATANPDFPHQSTLDQMFDEVQFESYRTLGDHTASSVFEGLVPDPTARGGGGDGGGGGAADFNQKLFAAVRDRWTDAPRTAPPIRTELQIS